MKKLQALQKEKELLKLYQQQSEEKSFPTGDLTSGPGFDENTDLAKKYQKQKLLQKLASLEDSSKFLNSEGQENSDLKAFLNKKFNSKQSTSDESQFSKLQQIKKFQGQQSFSSEGTEDQDNSFLQKWAKGLSQFSKGPSNKMQSQVGDAFKYYKVISTYKVPGGSHHGIHHGNHFLSKQGFDFTKKSSPFQIADSNPVPYGFQKAAAFPPVVKVVKIVKNQPQQSFLGQSGFGAVPQFNPFYQQGGSPQIVSKVKVFKPVHYTNSFGLKPFPSYPSGSFAKPVEVTVKKIIKPFSLY